MERAREVEEQRSVAAEQCPGPSEEEGTPQTGGGISTARCRHRWVWDMPEEPTETPFDFYCPLMEGGARLRAGSVGKEENEMRHGLTQPCRDRVT